MVKRITLADWQMKSDNALIAVSVIALIISAFAAGYIYFSMYSFKNSWFTGFATSTGTINITIESAAVINFTTNNINFSSGRVTSGAQNATLITNPSASTVTNGNWSTLPTSFVIRNIGNVNVSINVTSGKTAATFVGGTSPLYQFNITDKDTKSCLNYTGTGTDGNINTTRDLTTVTTNVCGVFPFSDTQDEIYMHIKLVIPSDSFIGTLSDIVTLTTTPA